MGEASTYKTQRLIKTATSQFQTVSGGIGAKDLTGADTIKAVGKGTGQAVDRLVSAGNGEAKVADLAECNHFNVLGRLIKTKYNEDTQLTECVIGVK